MVLLSAKFTRKPTSWDEALVEISDPAILEAAKGLPVFPIHNDNPLAYFPGTDQRTADPIRPQLFIAENRTTGKRYLVNTEGANYARYIALLPGTVAGSFGRDPRGPIRTITEVQEIRPTSRPNGSGSTRPVVLNCGHTAELNQIYTYRVGEACRCFACGQEGRE